MTSRGGIIPHIEPKKEKIRESKGHCPHCCMPIKIYVDGSEKKE